MKPKYIVAFIIAFAVSLGWNVFLIQRDKKMIEDFYRHQSMKRLSYPPSNSLREWCERQTSTQPECDPKQ